ncbi:MAG: hypothetical protein HY898_04350 [Deltaproteobacteria bacterium]|nr:hypothetical protein [Deltaproteobacteria bacterium]
MTKKTKVAGEIVSHCRKCGLDLNHIVVAMVNGQPKRVLCQTCKTEHAYHRPAEERGSSSPKTPRAPSARAARAESDSAALSAREKEWGSRIAGKAASAFTLYSPRTTFKADQLMRHPKFGDGYVAEVIDVGKIEVMFKDGPRTLAHGLTIPGG